MKIRPLFLLLAVAAILTSICANAQKNDDSRDQFEKALVECADYVTNVILDDEGKSRCD